MSFGLFTLDEKMSKTNIIEVDYIQPRHVSLVGKPSSVLFFATGYKFSIPQQATE